MKGSLTVLDRIDGYRCAALVVDGQLEDFLRDPDPSWGPVPGTVMRAVIERRLASQGAWMARLPGGNSGFLRGLKKADEGQPVIVQVSGYPESGKATPVRGRVSLTGPFAVILPGQDGVFVSRSITCEERRRELHETGKRALADTGIQAGLVLRTGCEAADDQEILDCIGGLLESCRTIDAGRKGKGPDILLEATDSHQHARNEWMTGQDCRLDDREGSLERNQVAEQLDPFRGQLIELPNGANSSLEQTRAMVAIDVNTGHDLSHAAGHNANLHLARQLPRQLRIRGIGGQIVVDFAPMSKSLRNGLDRRMSEAFAADGNATTLVGWTRMGHFELHMRRERPPLDWICPE